jgi:hypothetical protein
MTESTKKILLVVAIVLVLVIAGFAVWKIMGPSSSGANDGEQEGGTQDEESDPIAGGRTDPRDSFTDEELQRDTLENKGIDPEYQPVLVHSAEGRRLIEEKMRDIQIGHPEGFLKVRGTEKIGIKLLNIPNFSSEANRAILKMFEYMSDVTTITSSNYGKLPVYGKYEAAGQALRADLEKFLDIPRDKVNLSKFRGKENIGWLGSVGLNIMMLTNESTPSVKDINTINGKKASAIDREGLRNYLLINGFKEKQEKHLAKWEVFRNRSPYIGHGNRALAKVWLAEMDRLDALTRTYATKVLIGDGMLIELATQTSNGSTATTERVDKKTKMGTRIAV